MTYIRSKTIKGHDYFYEETTIREDGKKKTKHLRYIGKSLKTFKLSPEAKKESRINPENTSKIPRFPGVYYLYNRKGNLIYVGQAGDLKHRLQAYHEANNHCVPWEAKLRRNAAYYRYRSTVTLDQSKELEGEEIKKYTPKYNHYKTGGEGDT